MTEAALLVVGLALAVGAWAYLFRLPAEGLWPRTWASAAVLSAYAVVALAVDHRLGHVVGPIGVRPLAIGLAVGGGWLVATHVGHQVLCRFVPGFLERLSDLYAMREGDHFFTIIGPLSAMGVTEELFFRGYLQGSVGLAGSIAAYIAVQLVVGNWPLTLAALMGGAIWGTLAWGTHGLLAPVVAHVLWTSSLTFWWPLRGCGEEPGAADVVDTATGAPAEPAPAAQPEAG